MTELSTTTPALATGMAFTAAVALPAAVAFATGVALGAVFFGGLWWTVQRGTHSRHVALWFALSLLLRTGVTLFGFMLVAHGSWSRLALCLAGFALARVIVTRLTSLAPPSPVSSPVAARARHAP
jgi:F1F0 ATPase subunit 2